MTLPCHRLPRNTEHAGQYYHRKLMRMRLIRNVFKHVRLQDAIRMCPRPRGNMLSGATRISVLTLCGLWKMYEHGTTMDTIQKHHHDMWKMLGEDYSRLPAMRSSFRRGGMRLGHTALTLSVALMRELSTARLQHLHILFRRYRQKHQHRRSDRFPKSITDIQARLYRRRRLLEITPDQLKLLYRMRVTIMNVYKSQMREAVCQRGPGRKQERPLREMKNICLFSTSSIISIINSGNVRHSHFHRLYRHRREATRTQSHITLMARLVV